MQVAAYITEQLAVWGVERIYGVAGDGFFPWLDSLGRQSRIRYIACKHEAAAAMMASAEAKLTGRPAVCAATMGPGVVNLLNGLADAQTDRVPVVAITGQVESYKLGGAYKQYIPQEDVVRPVSFYTTTVAHPAAVGTVLHKAFVTAVQQRGVAHLGICKDVFERTMASPIIPELPRVTASVRPDRLEVEKAAQQLILSRKPILLLGKGARQTADRCRRLAEQLGAGVLLSLGAKGIVDESHPLVLGGLGEGGSQSALAALAEADLLVILGASWFPRAYVPHDLPVVQVDTQAESIHPHPQLFSVTADLDDVFPIWERRLESRRPDAVWKGRMEQLHTQFVEETRAITEQGPQELVKPETLLHALSRHVDEEAIIALDTGEHTLWFNRAFRAVRQTPLFSGKWRTMGFALPAAIAAKLACPDKQVVCVTGDGGLQMSLAELMTAVEQRVSFPLIVVNNGTLGLEEFKMGQAGYYPFGVRMHNPDFVRWAEACGVRGHAVHSVTDLDRAIQEALHADHLTVLDVRCTLPTLTERKKQIPFQAQA